jgi:hypothetical protein
VLTYEHFDALEICDEEPTSLAEAGNNPVWWQLLHDLRAAGFVAFDDDDDEAVSTDAGHEYLQAGWAAAAAQAEYEETPEDDDEDDVVNGIVMTSNHVDALDGCYDEPRPLAEAGSYPE